MTKLDTAEALTALKDALRAEVREQLIRELIETVEKYRDGTSYTADDGDWVQHYVDGINDAIGTLKRQINKA